MAVLTFQIFLLPGFHGLNQIGSPAASYLKKSGILLNLSACFIHIHSGSNQLRQTLSCIRNGIHLSQYL